MSIFHPELVKIDFQVQDKEDCLRAIARSFTDFGLIKNAEHFYEQMMKRERILSTGIGRGIAIPHLRDEAISALKVGIYLLDNEIDFDSLDRNKVKLVICFTIPAEDGNDYMKVLQKVSEFLRNENNRLMVFNCKEREELLNIFRRFENEK